MLTSSHCIHTQFSKITFICSKEYTFISYLPTMKAYSFYGLSSPVYFAVVSSCHRRRQHFGWICGLRIHYIYQHLYKPFVDCNETSIEAPSWSREIIIQYSCYTINITINRSILKPSNNFITLEQKICFY